MDLHKLPQLFNAGSKVASALSFAKSIKASTVAVVSDQNQTPSGLLLALWLVSVITFPYLAHQSQWLPKLHQSSELLLSTIQCTDTLSSSSTLPQKASRIATGQMPKSKYLLCKYFRIFPTNVPSYLHILLLTDSHETLPDDVLVKIHVCTTCMHSLVSPILSSLSAVQVPPRDPTVPIITPNDLK
jgi:hypothetical protein